jgi:hypothetical protein
MNLIILTLPVGPEYEGLEYWNRGRTRPVSIGRDSRETVVSGLSQVCQKSVNDDGPGGVAAFSSPQHGSARA